MKIETRVVKLTIGYVPQVRVRDFLWFKKWVCISRELRLYETNDSNVFDFCVWETEDRALDKLKQYTDLQNDKKALSQ